MSITRSEDVQTASYLFVRPREISQDLRFAFCEGPLIQTQPNAYTKKDNTIFAHVDALLEQKLNEVEEMTAQLLHEKSEAWFKRALTRDEIDNMLCSIVRGRPSKTRLSLRPEGVSVFDSTSQPLDFVPDEATASLIFQVRGISIYKDRFQIELVIHQMRLDSTPETPVIDLGSESRFV